LILIEQMLNIPFYTKQVMSGTLYDEKKRQGKRSDATGTQQSHCRQENLMATKRDWHKKR